LSNFPIVSTDAASRSARPRGGLQYRKATAEDLAANVAVDAWCRLLGLIADGVSSTEAIKTVGATRALVEGMLRGNAERRKEWNEARLSAHRRDWDLDLIIGICASIAGGLTAKKACEKYNRTVENFLLLVLADPVAKEEYDKARKIRAEMWADETIEIADNDGSDVDLNGRGNIAAVKRADTRIQARHKLMADFSKDRFGEDKNKTEVNVNLNLNHAERLEAAHARRRQLKRDEQAPIDAEIITKSKSTSTPASAPAPAPTSTLPDWLSE
jgi:hypothetical protein